MHALDLAPFLTRLLFALLAAAATWFIALDYGLLIISKIFRLSNVPGFLTMPGMGRAATGAAVGYAMLGSLVALLALAHSARPPAVVGLFVVLIILRIPHYLHGFQNFRRTGTAAGVYWHALASNSTVNRLAWIAIGFALATGCVAAALPAVWWDPIAYHLPITAMTLNHGTFAFDASMVQSAFPSLGEAAALPAYAIAGSAGPAMVTLGAGLFLGFAAGSIAEGIVRGTGPLASALVICSALWLWLAPSFYVDVPFALFVVAALLVAAQMRRANGEMNREPAAEPSLSIALICGLLCGAAAVTKYSGLAASVVVFAVAIAPARFRLKVFAAFAFGFVAVAAGWYARTWIATADPLYPFLSTALSHSPQIQAFAERYVFMTRHWCGSGESLWDALALPYRLLVRPEMFCGDPGYAPRLGAIFFLTAFIFIRRARRMTLVVVALMALWFVGSQQWRFALPALSLYAALVAAGTAALGERLKVLGGYALIFLCLIGVLVNWLPSTLTLASSSIVPAYRYIGGFQSAQEYLSARLESFAAARWLDGHGVPGRQAIALDDVRDYYFPQGTQWANPFYQSAWDLDWRAPAPDRYHPLLAAGIRYLVVNENPIYVRRTPTGIDWNTFALDRQNVLHRVFSENGVSIYDLSFVR